MSLAVMGRKADGTLVELPITAGGKLDTSATVEPAAGGATEAKQDDMIAALAGGLPLALGAGGGLKVDGSGTALPVSAASLPLPTGAATETTVAALNTKIPAAGALSDALANPTTALVGACTLGWSSALSQWRRLPVDSAGIPSVTARRYPPTSRSGATTLQATRVFAAFSATPYLIRAWSAVAGYVGIFNKASAPVTGDVPYGGRIYPVAAGGVVEIELESRLAFTTGIAIAHLTQIVDGSTLLSTVVGSTACLLSECLYD